MLQSLATFLGEVIAITAAVMLPLAGLAVIAAQIFTYVHGPYAKCSRPLRQAVFPQKARRTGEASQPHATRPRMMQTLV